MERKRKREKKWRRGEKKRERKKERKRERKKNGERKKRLYKIKILFFSPCSMRDNCSSSATAGVLSESAVVSACVVDAVALFLLPFLALEVLSLVAGADSVLFSSQGSTVPSASVWAFDEEESSCVASALCEHACPSSPSS